MSFLPVSFEWTLVDIVDDDGIVKRRHVMMPLARYGNVAAKQFRDGERYDLSVLEARSAKSHRFYFVSIKNAFDSLPEKIAPRFPSKEHLRKWALVQVGLFDEREFDCDTQINARRLANFIRLEDEYASITVHGKKVIVRRAKSQAGNAMTKEEFQASSKAVLELLDALIGTQPGTVKRENRDHA